MKHTARSGRLWVIVDNIQCSPDRVKDKPRRPKRIPKDAVIHYPVTQEVDHTGRDLLNAFRS